MRLVSVMFFFFSSRRRHTRLQGDWSSDVCSSDLIYAAGEPSIQKGTTANFNNIFVSRSTDGGVTWTAALVFHAPLNTAENNVFPTLAVDPTNGKLHAAWSDAHTVFYATSSDQGVSWSPALAVNGAPATTAVFPWIAARNGVVDLVYYGTTASSKDDPTAVWNVFLAQTTNDGATFHQSLVSNTPNHVGVICTQGTGCRRGTRNLLDLFKVGIDPGSGRAAVIYTDDTVTQTGSGAPLPQGGLGAQEGEGGPGGGGSRGGRTCVVWGGVGGRLAVSAGD